LIQFPIYLRGIGLGVLALGNNNINPKINSKRTIVESKKIFFFVIFNLCMTCTFLMRKIKHHLSIVQLNGSIFQVHGRKYLTWQSRN